MSYPRPRARAAGVALALAVAGLGLTGTGTAQAADPVAQVWVTTPDGTKKLASEGTIPFTATPQTVDIRIDANSKAQKFTGAGASVTEASAHLIQSLPADKRADLMKSLFSPSEGIGLNYLRQPLGSTDFNSGGFYTYEDTPGQFSISREQQEIIPVLKQATALNSSIRFMGSPWSPPAWMKTGNSLNGGELKTDQYQAYADYLVKAIKAYGQQGITLTDLTVQNEPEFATSYPSMSMTSSQQAEFFKVLDRTLTAHNLPTNLLAYDHNWDHPNYPIEVFNSTQGISRIIGAAFHCYGGVPSAQQQIVNAGKRVFFTECSGTDTTSTFADTLSWHAENLVVQNMRNGGETVINWNLALDQNGGPHQGHCTTRCNGVVEIANGNVTRGAEYYVLGHVAKFIKPGATRIGSTSQGAGGVQNVAFQNPDGSRAAYVVNTATSAQRISITDNNQSAAYTLPAGAVATLTWQNGSNPGDTQAPSVPGGLAATASGSSAIDLRWNASSDNTAVTGYRIYRGTTLA
ncbi:glycoside hydrolase family 30 beta sandwich domain-containing protein, partial [Streptomyces sp. TRM 70351]|uniref:glycoside hydrolase family 30 protein n=1 Tax=Streptomyces sp. TRM 70351 TaxID=3116552 RepID=UPI002E7B5A4D